MPIHPTLSKVDNAEHGKLRRILNQGLSDAHIRTMSPEISSIATVFANTLGEKKDRFDTCHAALAAAPRSELAALSKEDGWSEPKNMAEWCDFFTFDVMSQLVFGVSYDLLKDSENHWVIDGVSGQMRRVSFLQQLPELEDMKLHKLLFPNAHRKAYRFSQKSKAIMEARQQREKEQHAKATENGDGNDGQGEDEAQTKVDIFSKLLNAKDPESGEGLSQMQLWAESNLLIIAGSDTSSTGLAAAFFYLCRNPKSYARVVKEVRDAFPDPDQIRPGPTLLSCSYLRACVQEALRLAPAASGAMWREVLSGGLVVPGINSDVVIPESLEVATGIWSLNHHAEYFPEPFAYRPERWISGETDAEAVAKAKSAFATFSHGPRNCVGKSLTMVEIPLALAAVITRFDFRGAGGSLGEVGEAKGRFKGQYNTFWTFTSLKDGPLVQFKAIER